MKRPGFRVLIAAPVLVLALVACAGPTPYAPATGNTRDGYTDTALEKDRYRVTFAGNSRTSRQTVEDYLLYRAAEVTVASGHDWFKIASHDTEVETRFRGYSAGFGIGGFGPYYYRSGLRTSTARPISKFEAFANIQVFAGKKPAVDPQAYDARSVLQTLGPRIIRPAPGG